MQKRFFDCKIALVNKEEILEDFFRSLRVTLTNAFSYSKDHPYFIKSVESFKFQLEATLAVLNPLKIGVTNSGLVVDGKNLSRVGFYDELARLLHQRKIKSIEIRSGASLAELVGFLSVISMPQKDIFKSGGINALLEKKQLINFIIEELDYSAFLQGQGQECVDIWGYMLKEAAHSNDEIKLNKLADNFGSLIKQANEKDLFEAEEVSANINEFLICLKEKNKDKFDKCAKDVFLWLLRNKKSLNEEKLAQLKPVFNSLNQEDFSTLLWEGLSQDDDFDALSLQFFSKISGQGNSPKIAEGFFNKMNESQHLSGNPRVVKRIQDLLTAPQDSQVSAVYRNTLESLIKGISSSGGLFFDQKALKENYRYIVLNMLSIDEDEDNLKLAAGILEKELACIFEDNDVGFLKDLRGLLVKRKKEGISVYVDLEKNLSAFIEDIALSQSLPIEQEFLLEMVSSPGRKMSFYLDKIFNTPKAGRQVLNLFFRLFPGDLGAFYERVEQKLQDTEFLANLIDGLSAVGYSFSMDILKYIYLSANQLIKTEVLKSMRKIGKIDTVFLISQLNTDSVLLKKDILSVLSLDTRGKEDALDILLKIPSPWASKNKIIIKNMQIVYELGLKDASSRIKKLSLRRFFWNSQLRDKANKILREWNVS